MLQAFNNKVQENMLSKYRDFVSQQNSGLSVSHNQRVQRRNFNGNTSK